MLLTKRQISRFEIVNKIVLINISETINDNSKAIPDSIYRYIIISTKILISYFGAQMY